MLDGSTLRSRRRGALETSLAGRGGQDRAARHGTSRCVPKRLALAHSKCASLRGALSILKRHLLSRQEERDIAQAGGAGACLRDSMLSFGRCMACG